MKLQPGDMISFVAQRLMAAGLTPTYCYVVPEVAHRSKTNSTVITGSFPSIMAGSLSGMATVIPNATPQLVFDWVIVTSSDVAVLGPKSIAILIASANEQPKIVARAATIH